METTATIGLSTYGIIRRGIWKKMTSAESRATPR